MEHRTQIRQMTADSPWSFKKMPSAFSRSNWLIDSGYGWKHFKAYAFSQKLRVENDFSRSAEVLQERFRLIGVHAGISPIVAS